MALVAVKEKFQVVIPRSVREKLVLVVGDLLEADIQDGKIVLTPKVLIDRRIAEGLADIAAGRTHGPYATSAEAIAALEKRTNAMESEVGGRTKSRRLRKI